MKLSEQIIAVLLDIGMTWSMVLSLVVGAFLIGYFGG